MKCCKYNSRCKCYKTFCFVIDHFAAQYITAVYRMPQVWTRVNENYHLILFNGTAHFTKCKQLFEYQHLLLLRDIRGQSSNLYLNVVHFFNTSINKTSAAALGSCFPALVSNMHCSIENVFFSLFQFQNETEIAKFQYHSYLLVLRKLKQGIMLKVEVSLYHWPPVWLFSISLFCR